MTMHAAPATAHDPIDSGSCGVSRFCWPLSPLLYPPAFLHRDRRNICQTVVRYRIYGKGDQGDPGSAGLTSAAELPRTGLAQKGKFIKK
jgi:hypothetical protein